MSYFKADLLVLFDQESILPLIHNSIFNSNKIEWEIYLKKKPMSGAKSYIRFPNQKTETSSALVEEPSVILPSGNRIKNQLSLLCSRRISRLF